MAWAQSPCRFSVKLLYTDGYGWWLWLILSEPSVILVLTFRITDICISNMGFRVIQTLTFKWYKLLMDTRSTRSLYLLAGFGLSEQFFSILARDINVHFSCALPFRGKGHWVCFWDLSPRSQLLHTVKMLVSALIGSHWNKLTNLKVKGWILCKDLDSWTEANKCSLSFFVAAVL